MDTYCVPGVDHLSSYGRWAFVEFSDVCAMQDEFEADRGAHFGRMIETATATATTTATATATATAAGAAPAVAG